MRAAGLIGLVTATGFAVTTGDGVAVTIGGVGAAGMAAGAITTGAGCRGATGTADGGDTTTGAWTTVLPAPLCKGLVAPVGNEFMGCGTCEPAPAEGGLCVPPVWATATPAIRPKAATDINKVLRIFNLPGFEQRRRA